MDKISLLSIAMDEAAAKLRACVPYSEEWHNANLRYTAARSAFYRVLMGSK